MFTLNQLGGKGAREGVDAVLRQRFGQDLAKLTERELADLAEALADYGISVGADGAVKKVGDYRRDTEREPQ
ncbi:MAG: hypothetical protein HQL36_12155 [Alphaproteobacteria bacterium]|nr:hypothetical protein [Alphaproteobacteria bacterium]MBF0250211.1 hypothetical protein [Alphaproteobacteria bacterium]